MDPETLALLEREISDENMLKGVRAGAKCRKSFHERPPCDFDDPGGIERFKTAKEGGSSKGTTKYLMFGVVTQWGRVQKVERKGFVAPIKCKSISPNVKWHRIELNVH